MVFDLSGEKGNESKSKTLKFRVWIASLWDIDIDNFPKAVNSTIQTNPLKTGKFWRYFDAKFGTIKPSAAAGDSPAEGKLTVTATIEGISKSTLSWVYSLAGEPVIMIWERCSDGARFIGGTPCSGGLTPKYTSIGDQDGGISGIAMSFEGGECPDPFYFYEGDIPTEDPDVITGNALTITDNSRYILADNAAETKITSVTGITDSDIGRIIEVNGAGVAHPSVIESGANFSLSKGLSFTAKVGSRIFLQISKSGSNYVLIEVSRS